MYLNLIIINIGLIEIVFFKLIMINHSISKGINSFLDTVYLSIIVLCLVKIGLFTPIFKCETLY